MRGELLVGPEQRRRWSEDGKARIIEGSLRPGARGTEDRPLHVIEVQSGRCCGADDSALYGRPWSPRPMAVGESEAYNEVPTARFTTVSERLVPPWRAMVTEADIVEPSRVSRVAGAPSVETRCAPRKCV
jgi:hypothetical protein